MWNQLVPMVVPTWSALLVYIGFLSTHLLFAISLPGVKVTGRPDHNDKSLTYNCNALASWYSTLIILGLMQLYTFWTGVPVISQLVDNLGHIMTVSVIFADLVSIILYVSGHVLKLTHRMSGDHIYDFFMGAILHPRIGSFDIKIWAEVRISWFILFCITLSCVIKQFEEFGSVSASALVMLLAHTIYANACAKGEHCIPTTWDIFYEKFGWMLCFWNLSGVPFLYCAQSVYLLRQSQELGHIYAPVSMWFAVIVVVILLSAYCIWDSSQFQKNSFRMRMMNSKVQTNFLPPSFGMNSKVQTNFLPPSFGMKPNPNQAALDRNTFPSIPGSRIENPRYLTTAKGTPMLTDGWWKYARKIHYTMDVIMALCWGLSCGFNHFLPYFYVCFFLGMILHRNQRDVHQCKKKYGADWDTYVKIVPYAFIPGVY
jgi:delta24(24(1))-sterol reductase